MYQGSDLEFLGDPLLEDPLDTERADVGSIDLVQQAMPVPGVAAVVIEPVRSHRLVPEEVVSRHVGEERAGSEQRPGQGTDSESACQGASSLPGPCREQR